LLQDAINTGVGTRFPSRYLSSADFQTVFDCPRERKRERERERERGERRKAEREREREKERERGERGEGRGEREETQRETFACGTVA